MDSTQIESLYRKLVERDLSNVKSYVNDPFSPEIEIIKLMSYQISKGNRLNILPELGKITGVDSAYEYLIYEARLIANYFFKRHDRKNLRTIAEKAILLGSVPAYSLMHLGMTYEDERKYDEAIDCYCKIIQKYPKAMRARTNLSYLLASKRKKYTDAKKLILEGGKNWRSWINHKAVLVMEYKLGIPLIIGLTLLFWIIHSSLLVYPLLVFSIAFLISSIRNKEKFIIYITKGSLIISTLAIILLSYPTSISGIAASFGYVGGWNKLTPALVASPIDQLDLKGLMITTKDLPSSISWDGVIGSVDENDYGVNGDNAIQASFFPDSKDILPLFQSIYRFSNDSLAKENYLIPVRTDGGTTPPEWGFQSSSADQARIKCIDPFGVKSCMWVARYGRLLVIYDAFLSNVYTIEIMQNNVERIDEKITKALMNIE
jgi:tetratricopeptide (TPR) repeat protein